MATEDDAADLPTKTRELFDDIFMTALPVNWGQYRPVQKLPGDRIGWQVDLWETDGDARWRITVEAVGS